jgi:hypothetical protein
MTVEASWNGATDVASWRVLAGTSPGRLAAVAAAPHAGFETTIAAPPTGRYVAVQAVGRDGAVVGTSNTVMN